MNIQVLQKLCYLKVIPDTFKFDLVSMEDVKTKTKSNCYKIIFNPAILKQSITCM